MRSQRIKAQLQAVVREYQKSSRARKLDLSVEDLEELSEPEQDLRNLSKVLEFAWQHDNEDHREVFSLVSGLASAVNMVANDLALFQKRAMEREVKAVQS